jgi:hypothetical protein
MSYFFISKQPYKKNLIKYTVLDVDSREVDPYMHIIRNKDEKDKHLSFGSLFEIDVHGNWTETYKYDKHNYEMVVVLGKSGRKILHVYGNDIGDREIAIHEPYHDTELGDKLLIKPTTYTDLNYGTVYIVVHNITKAIMIHEMTSLMK